MYSRVLIPMDPDFSDLFDRQVEVALKLLAPEGKISVLYVNNNYVHHALASTTGDRPAEIENEIMAHAQEIVSKALPAEVLGKVICRRGIVHEEILQYAKKSHTDLIVMSVCKRPLERYLLGSNTRKVLTDARCAVFVAR